MEEQIKKETQKLIALIMEAERLPENPSTTDAYYTIAQRILSQRAYMTGLMTRAEQSYELRKLQLRTEKKLSIAAAENEAKTEEVYALYQNIKHAVSTAEEEVMLLKKWLGVRDTEYKQN